MSDSGTFLTRWLRLKATAGSPPRADTAPIDVSRLPPIESLTIDSDFSVFLQPGVPAGLLRQALQRAWRTDPAILHFIETAEMQWDFNDPAAMPGFGTLEALEPSTQVVRFSTPPAQEPRVATSEPQRDPHPGRDGQLDQVWMAGRPSHEMTSAPIAPPEPDEEAAGLEGDRPRRHGSALPRPL